MRRAGVGSFHGGSPGTRSSAVLDLALGFLEPAKDRHGLLADGVTVVSPPFVQPVPGMCHAARLGHAQIEAGLAAALQSSHTRLLDQPGFCPGPACASPPASVRRATQGACAFRRERTRRGGSRTAHSPTQYAKADRAMALPARSTMASDRTAADGRGLWPPARWFDRAWRGSSAMRAGSPDRCSKVAAAPASTTARQASALTSWLMATRSPTPGTAPRPRRVTDVRSREGKSLERPARPAFSCTWRSRTHLSQGVA